jgi:hypothetical protein
MGFALSGAAGAGGHELQEILKRRFLEQIQRQQFEQQTKRGDQQHELATRGLELQERNAIANEDLRRMAMEAAGQARTDANADRDASRELVEESRFQGQLKMLPKGSRITGQQAVKFAKFGASPMLKPATNELGEPEFEFAGTQDTAAAEARLAETQRGHDLTNQAAQARLEAATARAEAAAARGANAGQNTVVQQGIGPDGKPALLIVDKATGQARPAQMPAGFAPNRPARPVSGAERQTLAYFNRAKQASEDIVPLEEKVASAGMGSQLQQQYAPNMLQTKEQQAYRQAQRAFTEARLRKESGAAIPQGEYENDSKTYFAQPGDAPEVREQKRRARQTVLDGLKYASGQAHAEFYGDEAEPAAKGGGLSTTKAPGVGEQRTINGQLAEWDGKGWLPVKK